MAPEPDVTFTADGPVLAKNTRQCPKCSRIYVLRDYTNPCPLCKTALPLETPAG